MVKTRIACYFDVPRADNRSDYHNFVDVRRGSNDPRAFRLSRARSETTERADDRPRKTPSAPVRGNLNRAWFTTERADHYRATITSSQIDLRPHDSKNTLKRKVSAKTGVPFERLRMRLGPFNEVHLFDKNGPVTPKTNGVSVAMRDSLLPRATGTVQFRREGPRAAAGHAREQGRTPVREVAPDLGGCRTTLGQVRRGSRRGASEYRNAREVDTREYFLIINQKFRRPLVSARTRAAEARPYAMTRCSAACSSGASDANAAPSASPIAPCICRKMSRIFPAVSSCTAAASPRARRWARRRRKL